MAAPDLSTTLNGAAVSALHVYVPNSGPWHATVDMPGGAPLAGAAVIKLGTLELHGTIAPDFAGTHQSVTRARVVGGGYGWRKKLAAKSYHNDAGVKAQLVAADAAREAGETLGAFVPQFERLGVDYIREAAAAASTLQHAAGAAAWWVDFAGVTHAGPRPATPLASDAYHVMAYDPRARVATLGTSDPGRIAIGAILVDQLDQPGTIRELHLRATEDELRVIAWLGGSESGAGRLAGLMREIAVRSNDGQLHGTYRYRVVRMAGERVELQAVRKLIGLPDIAPVSMWPGVADTHAQLQLGAEVLVCFIDGDRAQPVITHFAGADGVGFVPTQLTLGGTAGPPAARQGDAVSIVLPPLAVISGAFTGLIGGVDATGTVQGQATFVTNQATGIITGGSSKVRVAT
jgi:uncharacterized Zn-binding protein involved in type VI secretion